MRTRGCGPASDTPAPPRAPLPATGPLADARPAGCARWDQLRSALRTVLDDVSSDVGRVGGRGEGEKLKKLGPLPFCVLGYDDEFELQPWEVANGSNGAGKPNRWGEPRDWSLPV